MASDFPAAFAALRDILRKHCEGLIIQADKPTEFLVITPTIGLNKKPFWFGAVMSKKSAVSYHLVPLYYNPKLKAMIPSELGKRLQGKTCFAFQRPDELLFAQLDELTRVARERWKKAGFFEPGQMSQERFDAAMRASGSDPEKIAATRKKRVSVANAKRKATLAKKRASKAR